MPKIKGLTDIIVILDRSGSMSSIKNAMEEGLNGFVREQKNIEGDARFTLVQFDSSGWTNHIDTVMDKLPIGSVGPITLMPRGGTPLLDAIGKTLGSFKAVAEKTVVVIITDGQENASREWNQSQIKALLEKFQTKAKQVIFLGANIDSFAVARDYGIKFANTRNYTASAAGTQSMTSTVSASIGNYRNTATSDLNANSAIFDSTIPDTIPEEGK